MMYQRPGYWAPLAERDVCLHKRGYARFRPAYSRRCTVPMESPRIIQMNIAHYEALLKLNMDDGKRSVIERLLADARESLALAAVVEQRN